MRKDWLFLQPYGFKGDELKEHYWAGFIHAGILVLTVFGTMSLIEWLGRPIEPLTVYKEKVAAIHAENWQASMEKRVVEGMMYEQSISEWYPSNTGRIASWRPTEEGTIASVKWSERTSPKTATSSHDDATDSR